MRMIPFAHSSLEPVSHASSHSREVHTSYHSRKSALYASLRLVGPLKWRVSFAEYSLFYRALLQKRPIIWRSLRDFHEKVSWVDSNSFLKVSAICELTHENFVQTTALTFENEHFGGKFTLNSLSKVSAMRKLCRTVTWVDSRMARTFENAFWNFM